LITSSSNQQIKDIKRLKDRKNRNETGLFYAEGVRLVYDAMRNPNRIQTLVFSPDLSNSKNSEEIVKNAKTADVPVLEVGADVFKSLSVKDGPHGLAAVVKQEWEPLVSTSELPGNWTVLVEVADPGNLGTILRTSDATGGLGVILVGHCTDPFDPAAVRASMGSIFSQRIVKTDKLVFTGWASNNKQRIIGTSDGVKLDYKDVIYSSDSVLLMGSERQGIPADIEAVCKAVVSIPMAGNCDSLNLAVAASVMMYERFNQQKRKIK
jgi:TrmH family RNA methyltransferase